MKSLNRLVISLSMFVFVVSPSLLPRQLQNQEKVEEKVRLNAQVLKDKFIKILNGTVKSVDGLVLTVEKDGVTYKVNTTSATKFRRKFWGVSKLSEIAVGDKVNVHGKWADNTKTVIDAQLIRDLSIQLRYGVFFGEVTTISDDVIVMKSVNRGNQTVTMTASAKLVNRKMENINLTDILVGHKIRVKGLWNNTASTITEVKQIKDFSIPEVISPSPRSED